MMNDESDQVDRDTLVGRHIEYIELLDGLLSCRLNPTEFRDRYISLWIEHRDKRAMSRSMCRRLRRKADRAQQDFQRGIGPVEEFRETWWILWGFSREGERRIDRLHSTVIQFTEDAAERGRDPEFFSVSLAELRAEAEQVLSWARSGRLQPD